MKCNACGKHWNTDSDAQIKYCPFCGISLRDGINLDELYKTGMEPFSNPNSPMDNLLQAVSSGFEDRIEELDANQIFNLACMYYYGRAGRQVDTEAALEYLKKAAENGQPQAQMMLADVYAAGNVTAQDLNLAEKWYESAASWINPYEESWQTSIDWDATAAHYRLGLLHMGGAVENPDLKRGFSHLSKAAKSGHADAQFYTYVCYINGMGTEENFDEAMNWLDSSVENGSVRGMLSLGSRLINGEGKNKDEPAGYFLIERAAQTNDPEAQNMLGCCVYEGYGTNVDREAGAAWWKKAAVQGFAQAQNNLATAYMRGDGVKKDYAQAFSWAKKAAEQKVPEAMETLANLYEFGLGTEVDEKKAAELKRELKDMGYYG